MTQEQELDGWIKAEPDLSNMPHYIEILAVNEHGDCAVVDVLPRGIAKDAPLECTIWMTTATFKPAYWRYLPPITKLPVAQD